ncbi:hypothetical protein O181_014726 [Austropuccinia psidii MF-1]|uniref:Retrotransposon gag domain-containing protein n=1 Tax=Austropuccinia psidii MF-1 TaxID=1389203 RepID=A0A9Q3C298_9BASI|nr:hypothetical protein [Austropuccinia psidii MF-1]
MEGTVPRRRGGVKSRRSRSFSGLLGGYQSISEGIRSRLGEAEDEEGEESEENKVEYALAGVPEASEAANIAHSNKPLVSQAQPNFLKMMEQMTQFMGQLSQAVSLRDNSKIPTFKTPSMRAPDPLDGTQAHKMRGFIQSCQLIFHNDPANFFSDRKKFLFSLLFETKLFTLFGDPNEVRKAEQELENLRMKESGHVSLYIADFRSLMSRIGDWGEGAYIHVYRRQLASRLFDQLASHPCTFDTLQELINITLELETKHHERQKERVQIKKRSLLSLDPICKGLLKTHL